jgi:hypothetical protein
MTVGRAAKYRFYNLKNFIVEFHNFLIWMGYFYKNLFNFLKNLFVKTTYDLNCFFKFRNL